MWASNNIRTYKMDSAGPRTAVKDDQHKYMFDRSFKSNSRVT